MRFSWWKYFWQSRIPPLHFRRIVTAPEWPEQWPADTVFVQGEDGQDWHAAFFCPCGCNDLIYLNLLPNRRPRSRIKRGLNGLPTITPSVWRTAKCRAHFIVRNGRVLMCRWDDDTRDD